MKPVRVLSSLEQDYVSGGQPSRALAPFIEGAAEEAGEGFWEWLTGPSYEEQTASRFDPMRSPITYHGENIVKQQDGTIWYDSNGNGVYDCLYYDSDGDGTAEWKWNEQDDRWDSIADRARLTATNVDGG